MKEITSSHWMKNMLYGNLKINSKSWLILLLIFAGAITTAISARSTKSYFLEQAKQKRSEAKTLRRNAGKLTKEAGRLENKDSSDEAKQKSNEAADLEVRANKLDEEASELEDKAIQAASSEPEPERVVSPVVVVEPRPRPFFSFGVGSSGWGHHGDWGPSFGFGIH